MIKAAFFDYDGTLVRGDYSRLSASTTAALAGLRKAGVQLWLATGRPMFEVPRYLIGEVPGIGRLDGYVACSGSWCVDDGGVFFSRTLDPSDVRAVVDAARRGEYAILVILPDRTFASEITPQIAELEASVNLDYKVEPLDHALNEPVLQMCAFLPPGDEDRILAITHDVACFRWSELFCDLVPASSGKGIGVRAALDHLGLAPDEAIAFGDGGNDVPMLEACGTSVAMGDGTPEARAAATYVTSDCDDDGIYRACVHLGLIEDTLGLCG